MHNLGTRVTFLCAPATAQSPVLFVFLIGTISISSVWDYQISLNFFVVQARTSSNCTCVHQCRFWRRRKFSTCTIRSDFRCPNRERFTLASNLHASGWFQSVTVDHKCGRLPHVKFLYDFLDEVSPVLDTSLVFSSSCRYAQMTRMFLKWGSHTEALVSPHVSPTLMSSNVHVRSTFSSPQQ